MKKTIIAAAASLALMTFAAPATAQSGTFISSAKLFQMCQQKDGSVEDAVCTGYIVAIADIMDTTALHGWSACIPADATIGYLQKVVTIWLKNNPDDHKYTANSNVADALAEAYPCGTPS